jgi:hypothetical protein
VLGSNATGTLNTHAQHSERELALKHKNSWTTAQRKTGSLNCVSTSLDQTKGAHNVRKSELEAKRRTKRVEKDIDCKMGSRLGIGVPTLEHHRRPTLSVKLSRFVQFIPGIGLKVNWIISRLSS